MEKDFFFRLNPPCSTSCWGAPSTSTAFLQKTGKALVCGYQWGGFRISSHNLYVYEPHGKGKNNPKNTGWTLQSTVRSQLDAITVAARSSWNLAVVWVTCSGWAGTSRGAASAWTAAQRKVVPAGWMATAELLNWSSQRLGEVRWSYLCWGVMLAAK